jgi:uncharacterized phage infection (PIP) family protein YhgE
MPQWAHDLEQRLQTHVDAQAAASAAQAAASVAQAAASVAQAAAIRTAIADALDVIRRDVDNVSQNVNALQVRLDNTAVFAYNARAAAGTSPNSTAYRYPMKTVCIQTHLRRYI